MNRLLYFPLSTPPDELAMRAALYWDELLTIAPDWYEHRSRLHECLAAEGVLRRIDLDECLSGWGLVDAIVRDVHSALSDLPGRDLELDPRLEGDAISRLYIGKLPMVVQKELEELGAATKVSDRFLNAAPAVLTATLSVIARFAAQALDSADLDGRTSIYTDRRYLVQQAMGGLVTNRSAAWKVQIGGRLPIPEAGTDPRAVLAFRERYKDERQRLAVGLTRLASSLSPGGEVDVKALILEVEAAERDVISAARARNMMMVKRGLSIIVAGGAATAAASLGGGEMGALSNLLASAGVNVATTSVRDPRDNEFSYLAEVRKKFAIEEDR